jgi:hypothetical protein
LRSHARFARFLWLWEGVGTDNPINYLSRAKLLELLGEEAATRLVESLGGRYFRVPRQGTHNYRTLKSLIGPSGAERLAPYAGDRLLLPRRALSLVVLIRRRLDAGIPARRIAAELECSVQRVWQVRARVAGN